MQLNRLSLTCSRMKPYQETLKGKMLPCSRTPELFHLKTLTKAKRYLVPEKTLLKTLSKAKRTLFQNKYIPRHSQRQIVTLFLTLKGKTLPYSRTNSSQDTLKGKTLPCSRTKIYQDTLKGKTLPCSRNFTIQGIPKFNLVRPGVRLLGAFEAICFAQSESQQ